MDIDRFSYLCSGIFDFQNLLKNIRPINAKNQVMLSK